MNKLTNRWVITNHIREAISVLEDRQKKEIRKYRGRCSHKIIVPYDGYTTKGVCARCNKEYTNEMLQKLVSTSSIINMDDYDKISELDNKSAEWWDTPDKVSICTRISNFLHRG